MSRLWLRAFELSIGKGGGAGIKTSDLRVSFEIKKTDSETPNEAKFQVWNLADSTLQTAMKEYDTVLLQAGYVGDIGKIYHGNIIGMKIRRENAVDTILELTCGDGDKAYNNAIINKTLAAGAKPQDVIDEVQSSMSEFDVQKGEMPELKGQALPRGKVMFGMAHKYAREAAYTTDTSWSIQDEKLTMCERDKYMPGEAVVLNYDTGLLNAEQTNEGINVLCLLNHGLRVNGRVKIDASDIQQAKGTIKKSSGKGKEKGKDKTASKEAAELNADGFYRILELNFKGDTHSNSDWVCEMVCVSIDASGGETTDKRGIGGK